MRWNNISRKGLTGIVTLLACFTLMRPVWAAEKPSAQADQRAASPLAWALDDHSVALKAGDQIIWRFSYAKEARKPHFHPVAVPGGPTLTVNSPADHPWHHGLWFSWKSINGLNYWEEDRKTGRSQGQTEWSAPKIERHDDFSARIVLDLHYRPPGKEPVLRERRIVEISPPTQTGVYTMDWTSTFTAGDQDVLLDRTPLPGEPGGKPWGGYAGLSVRFANDFQEARAVDVNGPIRFDGTKYRGRSPAMDYSGTIGGVTAGLAILDHPSNRNAPTPWYVIRAKPMRYMSPAVICYGPIQLKPHESFTLRYRILVHPDRWKAQRLRQGLAHYR
ncbi:MAG: hypothetical protein GXP27_04000 [Planctomycetes bacterium]|nr:hypothetical protein [Planctomycetota bacterium]